MKCPNCGQSASGRFCSQCGTVLGKPKCPTCGATPPAGARFCTQCGGTLTPGSTASAGAGGGNSNVAWWVAGALLVVVILALALPRLNEDSGSPVPPPQQTGAPAGGIDLASLTPREAADRLFNRVMTAVTQGDTAVAVQFLPMAVQAYDMARPLDQDGFFHMGMLQIEAQDFPGALASAQEGLAADPDNLLNLSIAGQAAAATGDSTSATQFFQRFLDVYDAQIVQPKPEYQAHANLLPEMKAEAEAYLGG